MSAGQILSDRLIFIPFTLDSATSILEGNLDVLEVLGLKTDKNWPDDETIETLPKIIKNLELVMQPTGFESWMIVKQDDMFVIDDAGFNIKVEKFILDSSNISTCSGCESCINTGTCIIQDDITKIIDNMKRADGYIFASPAYNYNMTAQMKSLLDRTFCLNDYNNGWKSRLLPDKKAIVIGVCSGKAKE